MYVFVAYMHLMRNILFYRYLYCPLWIMPARASAWSQFLSGLIQLRDHCYCYCTVTVNMRVENTSHVASPHSTVYITINCIYIVFGVQYYL